MAHESRLTSKSQVTIPKDVRRALGVGPGEMVRFEVHEDGEVTLARVDDDRAFEERKADFLRRVRETRREFRKIDQMPGMDGMAYQRWIRGDGPDV